MTKSEPQVRDGRLELSEVPETGSAWSSESFFDATYSVELWHEQSLAAPAMASASDGTTTRWPAAGELHGGRSVFLWTTCCFIIIIII